LKKPFPGCSEIFKTIRALPEDKKIALSCRSRTRWKGVRSASETENIKTIKDRYYATYITKNEMMQHSARKSTSAGLGEKNEKTPCTFQNA
jgi:hypothetical protein